MVRYEVANPQQNLKWFEESKIFKSYCSKYKRLTPFLKDSPPEKEVNQNLMTKLDLMDSVEFTMGTESKASEEYPDAALTFRNFNQT
jgi:hypothetical protein